MMNFSAVFTRCSLDAAGVLHNPESGELVLSRRQLLTSFTTD
jgi:hypothetical protein